MPEIIVQVTPKLLDEIVEASGPLLSLRSERVTDAIGEFRRLTLRGGHAVYAWNATDGIVSLGASEVRLPGTHRLVDALRYVVQSVHFAIYLFSDFEKQLGPPTIALLKRLGTAERGSEPRLVFVSMDFVFPADIADSIIHLQSDGSGEPRRPRLRDGHWLA